jgi:hypothetical protein
MIRTSSERAVGWAAGWLVDAYMLDAPGFIAVSYLEIGSDTQTAVILVTVFAQVLGTLFWAGIAAWLGWELQQFPRRRRSRSSTDTASSGKE